MIIDWDNRHKLLVNMFGEPRLCECVLHNMSPADDPDEIVWVERPEDLYALSHYNDKRIAILRREEWLKAGGVNIP